MYCLGANSRLDEIDLKTRKNTKTFKDFGRNDYDRAMDVFFERSLAFGLNNSCKLVKEINFKTKRTRYYSSTEQYSMATLIYIPELGLIVSAGHSRIWTVSTKSKRKIRWNVETMGLSRSLVYDSKRCLLFCVSSSYLLVCSMDKEMKLVQKIDLGNTFYTIRKLGNSYKYVIAGGSDKMKMVSV